MRPVTVYEVGPRDGLQNESVPIPTGDKVELVERLVASGLGAIEVGSFVSPGAVPQLADGEEVFRRLERKPGIRYVALVPNLKGYERSRAVEVGEIAVFTAASESFNLKNIRCGIDESFARFAPVAEAARTDGVTLRGYVSTAFHCPYEGPVDPAAVVRVTRRLFELGVEEVSIGDTIGAAVPTEVHRLLEALAAAGVASDRIALHFHDTRGTALANVVAALDHGVSTFDSSVGGLGGCPYAPGASGNVATEDLVYLLEGMGFSTAVDLEALCETARFVQHLFAGRRLPSRLAAAGPPHPLGAVDRPR